MKWSFPSNSQNFLQEHSPRDILHFTGCAEFVRSRLLTGFINLGPIAWRIEPFGWQKPKSYFDQNNSSLTKRIWQNFLYSRVHWSVLENSKLHWKLEQSLLGDALFTFEKQASRVIDIKISQLQNNRQENFEETSRELPHSSLPVWCKRFIESFVFEKIEKKIGIITFFFLVKNLSQFIKIYQFFKN